MKIKINKKEITQLEDNYRKGEFLKFSEAVKKLCEKNPDIAIRYMDAEFLALEQYAAKNESKVTAGVDDFRATLRDAAGLYRLATGNILPGKKPLKFKGKSKFEFVPSKEYKNLSEGLASISYNVKTYERALTEMYNGAKTCLTLVTRDRGVSKVDRWFYKSDKALAKGLVKNLKLPIAENELSK